MSTQEKKTAPHGEGGYLEVSLQQGRTGGFDLVYSLAHRLLKQGNKELMPVCG